MQYLYAKPMKTDYDVIIIGGGLVGASFATALANSGLSIALIDDLRTRPTLGSDRSIVLSHTSMKIFNALGIWCDLAADVSPVKHIHVSDRLGVGFTALHAEEENLHALGYVSSAQKITTALDQRLQQLPSVDCIDGKYLTSKYCGDHSEVSVSTTNAVTTLTCKLTVAADGQNSSVRESHKISTHTFDYQHHAIICKIELKRDHNFVAYERFTKSGSIAILPVAAQQCSLVWAVPQAVAARMLGYNDEQFLAELQQTFGYRLGKFLTCTVRQIIPLQLVTANQQSQQRLVLIGNAAHTLHPIAGQGFNLGLRDMSVLAETIVNAKSQGRDIGSREVLTAYIQSRQHDQFFISNFTHQLIGIFSQQILPFAIFRQMGLVLLEVISPFKHYLIEKALGKSGRLPRLACGLPLG